MAEGVAHQRFKVREGAGKSLVRRRTVCHASREQGEPVKARQGCGPFVRTTAQKGLPDLDRGRGASCLAAARRRHQQTFSHPSRPGSGPSLTRAGAHNRPVSLPVGWLSSASREHWVRTHAGAAAIRTSQRSAPLSQPVCRTPDKRGAHALCCRPHPITLCVLRVENAPLHAMLMRHTHYPYGPSSISFKLRVFRRAHHTAFVAAMASYQARATGLARQR